MECKEELQILYTIVMTQKKFIFFTLCLLLPFYGLWLDEPCHQDHEIMNTAEFSI